MTPQPKKPLTEKDKIFVFCNHERMTVNEMATKLNASYWYILAFMKENALQQKFVRKPGGRLIKTKEVKAGYFNVDDLKNMF